MSDAFFPSSKITIKDTSSTIGSQIPSKWFGRIKKVKNVARQKMIKTLDPILRAQGHVPCWWSLELVKLTHT